MRPNWKGCLFVSLAFAVVGTVAAAASMHLFMKSRRSDEVKEMKERARSEGQTFGAKEAATCFEEAQTRYNKCHGLDFRCLDRVKYFQEGCLDRIGNLSFCDELPDRPQRAAWIYARCLSHLTSFNGCVFLYQRRGKYCDARFDPVLLEFEACVKQCPAPIEAECVDQCKVESSFVGSVTIRNKAAGNDSE